ncbi:MAG: TrmH family RNA methyltransferase [Candidatus Omnitrophota bacterium]
MDITSTANPRVKNAAKLRYRKHREQSGLTIIDGWREVSRARETGVVWKECFVCPELLELFAGQQAVDQLTASGGITVTEHVYKKLCFGDRKEGVTAVIRAPHVGMDEQGFEPADPIVVLDHIEKPGNIGAILRSCDGAGVKTVIVADSRTDLFNPNVIRASTGVIFSLNLMQGTAQQTADLLRRHDVRVLAATPEKSRTYFTADMTGRIAFVLGAEDAGLQDFWLEQAHERITVPMSGKADSLNVSVTAALLIYEAFRQRRAAA